jgi:hypothetical protein
MSLLAQLLEEWRLWKPYALQQRRRADPFPRTLTVPLPYVFIHPTRPSNQLGYDIRTVVNALYGRAVCRAMVAWTKLVQDLD